MSKSLRYSFWTVVAMGAIILTLATGLRQSFGLFLRPMTMDLGFGREAFAFAIAVQNILWGVGSPIAGAIADKWGPGKVAVAGGLFYTLGLVLMGLSDSGADVLFGTMLVGMGLACGGFSVVLGAIGRAAPPAKRGMALGIATAGGSFGQFAVVPVGQMLLMELGWSGALVALAVLAFLMVPLARGVAGWQADGPAADQSLGEALREAWSHSGFRLLTIAFFVCGFQVVFVGTHLPAFLADKQMPAWLGGWTLAVVGLFNIIGSFVAGMLAGRYRIKYLLAGLYLARSGVFLLFLAMPLSEGSVLLFGALLGLLWLGTVPLTSGLIAQIFGPTYMSMLYGVTFLGHQAGSSLGAWMGGWAFDTFGSYDIMWWINVALGVAAAVLHWPIADKPLARLTAAPAAAPAP